MSRGKQPPPLPAPEPSESMLVPGPAPRANLSTYAAEVRACAERLVEDTPHYEDPVWDRYRELRDLADRMRA